MDDDSYVEMGEQFSNASASQADASNNLLDRLLPTRGFWRQLGAFRNMAWPYFAEQATARSLFAVMVVLTLCNSAVRVIFSYLARDFWTALSDNQPQDFYRIIRHFLTALLLLAPITVFYRYQRQRLAIHWRGWMTERVLHLYASNSSVYYGLERANLVTEPVATTASSNNSNTPNNNHSHKAFVDNPDQRISEDVRSFTEFSLALFLTVLTAFIDLCCFSTILFTILPRLFIAILCFATLGTVATILIGRVLIQLNYDKLQKEANLRFALVRLREYAEQIAFLGGEDVEKRQIQYRLSQVIRNMHDINDALRNLEFFTTYYAYITWILPILVVAPSYFAGQVELGVVQQAAASFSHVLDDLSVLVTQWDSLSEFSAGIDRLFTFLSAMQQLDPHRSGGAGTGKSKAASSLLDLPQQGVGSTISADAVGSTDTILLRRSFDDPSLALVTRNLTLTIPTQDRILFENLNLRVKWGDRLLISGNSGVGKSSLLRAMVGIWKTGRGEIYRPADDDMFFLPQKPYCCVGTLRDQIRYPRTGSTQRAGIGHDGDRMLTILRAVDLAHLPERAASMDAATKGTNGLDVQVDWTNTLSLGEQQRLGFARVLWNQPKFVVLDEATSSLPVQSEAQMYTLLQSIPGVTYISVGHRQTLESFHQSKLLLA